MEINGVAVGPGAILAEIDLKGVSLPGVNLRGANLLSADLSKANLEGADLTDSILTKAKYSGRFPAFKVKHGGSLGGR